MVLNSNDAKPLDELNRNIERLIELAEVEDAKGIMEELKKIVPEYCPQENGPARSNYGQTDNVFSQNRL